MEQSFTQKKSNPMCLFSPSFLPVLFSSVLPERRSKLCQITNERELSYNEKQKLIFSFLLSLFLCHININHHFAATITSLSPWVLTNKLALRTVCVIHCPRKHFEQIQHNRKSWLEERIRKSKWEFNPNTSPVCWKTQHTGPIRGQK